MVLLTGTLKHEAKRCRDELQCNIVVIQRSQAKVGFPTKDAVKECALPTEPELASEKNKTGR